MACLMVTHFVSVHSVLMPCLRHNALVLSITALSGNGSKTSPLHMLMHSIV